MRNYSIKAQSLIDWDDEQKKDMDKQKLKEISKQVVINIDDEEKGENEDQILDQPSIEINGWNGNKGRSYLYGLPLLDPVTDMEIDDDAFKEILLRIQLVERELQTKTEYHTNEMKIGLSIYKHKLQLQAQIQAQERYIAKSKKMIFEDELNAMTAVLKRFFRISYKQRKMWL
ncbi:MAG: hypothetical protein EZS28_041462 [Streblomastix strix]|uniref:Exosome RNA helicase MTR4-like beta-barrel domain-containing protein n=1 Tax=Streblomastix strix TaxID=222440 RepID=A0A5J4TZD5_9EUKA|nr:MAG: hypothetical protein EZS28_041462 [Streblomastix strix]